MSSTAKPRPRVLVVVPAFNEQDSVGSVVHEIKGVDPLIYVLVVDDGSGDRTARAAKEAGAAVCQLPFNLGVGGAMRTGYRYALREGYDVVVQVDADGQHDATYIPRLIEALEHADVVVGARFAGEGDYAARGPRRWAMRLLAGVFSRLARRRLSDVTSGFRAVNRRGDPAVRGALPLGVPRRHRGVPGHRGSHRLHGGRGAGLHADPIHRAARARPPSGRCSTWRARWSRSGSPCAGAGPTAWRRPSGADMITPRNRSLRPPHGGGMKASLVLGIVGSIVTLVLLFEMMRRQRLREKYAVFWAVVAVLTLVVALFPGLLEWIAKLAGVAVPSNLLFFVASMLLLVVSVQHSPAGPPGGPHAHPRGGGRPAAAPAGPGAGDGPGAPLPRAGTSARERKRHGRAMGRSCRWSSSPSVRSRCSAGASRPPSPRKVSASRSSWSTTVAWVTRSRGSRDRRPSK